MKLTVFFSWQMETDSQGYSNKKLLDRCIQKALKELQNKGQFKGVFFDYKEGMRNVSGTPDVAAKMFEHVDKCDIFIGDFSVVQKTNRFTRFLKDHTNWIKFRYSQNSNVISEYSRAIGKYPEFEDNVILVANTENADPVKEKDFSPFDWKGRRWPITFRLNEKIEKSQQEVAKIEEDLTRELTKAIRLAIPHAIEYRKRKYYPFLCWEEHSSINKFSGSYIFNERLSKYADIIRNAKRLRIIGLSGLGKTRLVLETFRKADTDVDKLNKQNYLYCDLQETSKEEVTKVLKNLILQDFPEAIVILDNCDEPDLGFYNDLWVKYKSPCRLITIFNNPNESALSGFEYCLLNRDFDDIVVKMLSRLGLSESQISEIERFAGGIPMMGELLEKALRSGGHLGELSDDRLISKILGVDKDDKKRIMLQTLSLFDYVGYYDDLRAELEYLIKNKNITSIDSDETVLMNDLDNVIKKYSDLSIIERRGRQIGVRPLPIALNLIVEWFESCSLPRFLNVIKVLQNAPNAEALVKAMGNQLKNLDFNPNIKNYLDSILGIGGPFASAEVMNTEIGSRLLRIFGEISPVAVTNLLSYILNVLSIEDLRNIDKGRRNLVWLLEKLCFNPETFNEAAYLMLRFGMAENESISNNATGQFLALFPSILPSTAASTSQRIEFLNSHKGNIDVNKLIIDAAGRVLATSDFIYFHGPENMGTKKLKNYEASPNEIGSYINSSLGLLVNCAKTDLSTISQIAAIFESRIAGLCRTGFGDMVLPYVFEFAELLNYDWDKMWDTLSMFEKNLANFMSAAAHQKYLLLTQKLEKSDIVSKFRRVEKKGHDDYKKDFNSLIEMQHKEYEKLAHEFIEVIGYNKETLHKLMRLTPAFSFPFGNTMAKICDRRLKEGILYDGINIVNNNPGINTQILSDFINSFDNDEFYDNFDKIKGIGDHRLLFSVIGRRRPLNIDIYIDFLFDIVKQGKSLVQNFQYFLNNLNISEFKYDIIKSLFNKILSLPDGTNVIIQYGQSMIAFSSKFADEMTNFYVDLIVSHNFGKPALSIPLFPELSLSLLRLSKSETLARSIVDILITHIMSIDELYINDWKIDELVQYLFENHFDIIWAVFSQYLISEDNHSIMRYKIKNIIFSPLDKHGLMDINGHEDILKKWCSDNPDVAPSVLISLIPWNDNNGGLSPMTRFIVDNYGDNDAVLSELSSLMGSFHSEGSVLPYYESRKLIWEELSTHSISNVRKWAQKEIGHYQQLIDYFSNLEQEGL